MNTLEDKKGEDIVLLDIHDVAYFADYFVICSGLSDRQLDSLADAVEETVKKQAGLNGRREGSPREGWVLVDFGDIVVHLFSPDQREYYDLELLWERGKTLLRLQ